MLAFGRFCTEMTRGLLYELPSYFAAHVAFVDVRKSNKLTLCEEIEIYRETADGKH